MTKLKILAIIDRALLKLEVLGFEEPTPDTIFSEGFLTIENRYPGQEEESKYKIFVDGYSIRLPTLYRVESLLLQIKQTVLLTSPILRYYYNQTENLRRRRLRIAYKKHLKSK